MQILHACVDKSDWLEIRGRYLVEIDMPRNKEYFEGLIASGKLKTEGCDPFCDNVLFGPTKAIVYWSSLQEPCYGYPWVYDVDFDDFKYW